MMLYKSIGNRNGVDVNEKGYSLDVADATTIYNECGECGEYHAYYYIDEVEFIKSDIKGNGN